MTARISAVFLALVVFASLVSLAEKAAAEKAPAAPKVDLKALFAEPTAAVDQDGKAILTKRAVGHRVVTDYNGDGRMYLLTTGGVFTKGEDTRIWVVYGKVRNVPAKTAVAKPKSNEAGSLQ